MSNQKHILILCSHSYEKQPRVLRTIEALRPFYHLTVAGSSGASSHEVSFIDLSTHLRLDQRHAYWHFDKPAPIRLPMSFYHKYIRQKQFYKPFYYEYQYWTASRRADLALLKKHHFDLIISHGIDTLPLAVKLSGKEVPVIFNAHEYYPLEFEQDKQWLASEGTRALHVVKKYLPQCAMMFCVSEEIMKAYQRLCQVEAVAVTNATSYADVEVKPTGKTINILHHGAAMRARRLELMADMMDSLPPHFQLSFMLVPTEEDYLEELRVKYANHDRIRFVPPVDTVQIPHACNQYDIGLFILPPVNFNWLNALPNKFFEYIQGRLAIAVSPNPDMKRIVQKYGLGVISDDYTSANMAAKLSELTRDRIDFFKQQSAKHAKELSAEHNQQVILETVTNLLKNRCAA